MRVAKHQDYQDEVFEDYQDEVFDVPIYVHNNILNSCH